MHTHSVKYSESLHHPLYIANGVTGIRDMSGQLDRKDNYWAGSHERLFWNAELSQNKIVNPRYVLQSSYQMDGSASVPDGFPEFFKLQQIEDVDSLLNFYKNEKVDFIKVYQQIPAKIYKHLALKAPKYGMHLAGHKPIFVSLEDAILLGQKSFEHGRLFLTEAFPGADSLRTSANWQLFYSKSRKSIVKDYNPEMASRLMLLMREHNSYWTPTLQTLKFEAYAHDSTFIDNPNIKYIPYIIRKFLWGSDVNNNRKRNLSIEGKNLSRDIYSLAKEQVATANEIGVPIMTGTDVTDSYVFAGFSIHDELEDLTKSGLSNLQAIQCATIIPAKFVGEDKKYGTIETGKIADLVILNKNPLEEIANSREIFGVVMNGIYYDQSKIEELKVYSESIVSTFHINIKVLYSLLSSPLMRVQLAD
ncbi:MAG: amidohydrolase family protein [Daejeonella sp.]|uniref:amidohydrolase family protein n=1 Tax=Daejeonella sp. TaxID=2805397 RepID=UPI0027367A22|nr:amidohydrolase family protein [Daejeonella sp.]MDP3468829.1 amidohydrolase family protein [Daejeonella sp.]